MNDPLHLFEQIARRAYGFTDRDSREPRSEHPFEVRNVHEKLPPVVRELFDNGHYSQATFEAFKFVDKLVQHISRVSETGQKLMFQVFCAESPMLALTSNATATEKDEQKGFGFLFAGGILAIRNPRGHEIDIPDSPDICLDHLAFASMLLRRLEQAGIKCCVSPQAL